MNDEPFVEPETDQNPGAEKRRDPIEKLLRSVGEKLKTGTERARRKAQEKAEEAAPTVKSALRKAAYQLSYGAAYGSSFGLTLLKELVPPVVKDGGTEGFRAGGEAARRAVTPKPKDSETGEVIDIDVEYTVS